jgi:hypothetical protein
MQINLTFSSVEDVNKILQGLSTLPYAQVFQLMNYIQQTASEQVQRQQVQVDAPTLNIIPAND